ncbi:MAG TPA: hypothetical protein VF406_02820 [Thermodesulfobacteriota bacterium]
MQPRIEPGAGRRIWSWAAAALGLVAAGLAACGGGGGGGGGGGATLEPARRVVYRADQDTDTTAELYMVELAAPGAATKLNPPLVAGGNVLNFAVVPAVP